MSIFLLFLLLLNKLYAFAILQIKLVVVVVVDSYRLTLVPEVFLDFSPHAIAAKRRVRKTSGYLGLESHFHADARVRI